ncbi:membrane protein, partial [mine drainage metagenome]
MCRRSSPSPSGPCSSGFSGSSHHRTFHYIRRFDSPLLWINIGFLATVAINPFLLGVFIRYQETSTAVMLYGGGQAVTVGLLALIWWYATWDRRLVDASLASRLIDYYRYRGLIFPIAFSASVGIAYFSVTRRGGDRGSPPSVGGGLALATLPI